MRFARRKSVGGRLRGLSILSTARSGPDDPLLPAVLLLLGCRSWDSFWTIVETYPVLLDDPRTPDVIAVAMGDPSAPATDPQSVSPVVGLLQICQRLGIDRARELHTSVSAFLSAETWVAACAILEADPVLLSEDAGLLLAASTAMTDDSAEGRQHAGFLREHVLLLRRALEVGTPRATAEVCARAAGRLDGLPLSAEVVGAVIEAFDSGSAAEVAERARRALDAVPQACIRLRAQLCERLGDALCVGGPGAGEESLRAASEAYRAQLDRRLRDGAPLLWAHIAVKWAGVEAMREHGPSVGRTGPLLWACELYEETLEVFTREAHPQQWAVVRSRQGDALLRAGSLDVGIARLRDAVSVLDPDELPAEWSNAQLTLGRALLARALDPEVLRQLSIEWSGTHAILGLPGVPVGSPAGSNDSSADDGEDDPDTVGPPSPDQDLREAIDALQVAAMVRTAETDPFGFARIEELLGMAHFKLSETHGSGAEREAAIRAWQAAAGVVTPEVDWAWHYRIQGNLRRAGYEGQPDSLSDQALAKALDDGLSLMRSRVEAGDAALAEDRPRDALAAFESAADLCFDLTVDFIESMSDAQRDQVNRLRLRILQGEMLSYRALGDIERAAAAGSSVAAWMRDADEPPQDVAAQLAIAGRLFIEVRDWDAARERLTDALAMYERSGTDAEAAAAVRADLHRVELESTTPLGRLGDSFEAGELSEEDYRYVVELQAQVLQKSTAEERRPLLAQGIWRFGKPFCDSFARWPDPSGGVLLPMMESFEMLMGWVNGAVLSARADEPSRRASAAAQLLRDRALGDDECHGELERGAAWAILSLPLEHPARDQVAAVDMLVEHLNEHGPHEEYEWLSTAAMLLAPGLLSDMDADGLLAETLSTLANPLPADEPGVGSSGSSQAEYAKATRVWAGLAAVAHLAGREEAPQAGHDWDIIHWRTQADAILRLTLPDPATAREVVLQVRDALGEASAPGAGIGQAMLATIRWLMHRERWEDVSRLSDSVADVFDDEQLRARVGACSARAMLAQDRPREAVTLLRSVLPVLQEGYLAAVAEAEIAAGGAAISAAADTLAMAYVRSGDWMSALQASDGARSLRARYSAALRGSPEGPRLLSLQRELYQASRGIPGPPPTEEDFKGDRLAHGVPAAQQLLEKVRVARPRLTGGLLESPPVAELARCCQRGEGVLLLAVTDFGTLVGLVTPEDTSRPAEVAELPEWTVQRWSQVLESSGGWLSALAEPDENPPLPAVLSGSLAVVHTALGATLETWLSQHRVARLVIVPSRQLQLVPLWALPAFECLPVVVSPSAAQFVASRRQAADSAEGVIAPSVVVVEDPSGDLAMASVESEAVRAAFAASEGSVQVLEAGATELDISAALHEARIFHFCGHGRAVAFHPDQSALLVAAPSEQAVDLGGLAAQVEEWHELPGAVRWTDVSDEAESTRLQGRLYEQLSTQTGSPVERWLEAGPTSTLWQSAAREATVCELWSAGDIQLSRAFDHCWLATLSACESGNTGLGTQLDEYGGLPAALQLAGARTVVAALWRVSEPVTALFMRHFYAELARGAHSVGIAECVLAAATHIRTLTIEQAREEFDVLAREAQSDSAAFDIEAFAATLRGDAPPFADPWFWAPFFMTGSGRLPIGGAS